ncbi:Tol-Pal system beta propeller repeat protein TolB [Oceanibacterium hippocampi]|uniref:Tol-Pal system protein TolB n=1 Tax=Oceanibacterium hippocampi TaxID=745714 RepID=A0A1Y5U0Q8_9PROT|nr:Tol-Pal system beta propeller repeat protein TolB [Oceanibacterium hippocampi]SLN73319.1 translocation protein TolB [Oceanibacterium hippocampi]
MTEKRFSGVTRALGGLIAFLAVAVSAIPAHAVLEIDITQGNVDPLPIAVSDFHGDSDTMRQTGQEIAGVIRADLERSGLFRPIDPRAFIQKPADLVNIPRFGDWRILDAQALVSGQTSLLPDGRLQANFRLWDVFAEQHMVGLRITTTPDNWRRIAHKIADAIYKRMTGEEGYFDTRIVYIAESGPGDRRVKRLAIMDQDGANHRFLTNGSSLVLTPRFSPTQQEITYLSYFNDKPRVYLYNIDTGQQEVLGEFPGMTFAPRFSPTGNRVAMSLATNGNSDVYVLDLRTRVSKRLTDHPAIDTSPCFSPDGRSIVFNSDRGGTQQLYVMDADGGNVRRISFGEGRYATPVWSPRGDLIAFTKIWKGKFYIGVVRPDGSGERLLTESYLDEGPTWAPNGRVLMFFRQTPFTAGGKGGDARLWSVDLTGHNERMMVTPMDASDPAWSPRSP